MAVDWYQFRPSGPPLQMLLALDVSASMAGEKLELLVETAEFLVKELSSRDELGIVVYGTDARTALQLTPMTAAGKGRARDVLSALQVESATNLSGGLLRAISELHEGGGAGGGAGVGAAGGDAGGIGGGEQQATTRAVLLLTDGMANCGETRAAPLCALMRSSLALVPGGALGDAGATVHTFAYGRDADTALLDALAEAGSGMAYAIANVEDCALAFASCVGGLLSVVAQDLRLVLEPTSAAAFSGSPLAALREAGGVSAPCILRVLTKFPQTPHRGGDGGDGNDGVEVALKDLYAEEQRDILIELPPGVGLRATLRYANTLSSSFEVCRAAAEPPPPPHDVSMEGEQGGKAVDERTDIARHWIRHLVTAALEDSRRAADARDLRGARGALARVRAEVRRLCALPGVALHACCRPDSALDPTVAALLATVASCEAGMADQRTYDGESTSSTIGNTIRMHSLQRSNTMDTASPHAAVYRTRSQTESMTRSPSLHRAYTLNVGTAAAGGAGGMGVGGGAAPTPRTPRASLLTGMRRLQRANSTSIRSGLGLEEGGGGNAGRLPRSRSPSFADAGGDLQRSRSFSLADTGGEIPVAQRIFGIADGAVAEGFVVVAAPAPPPGRAAVGFVDEVGRRSW